MINNFVCIQIDVGDGSGYWSLVSNTYYVRDISGKEIAIYSGSSLTQWNIWGLDNVGKINSDTTRNYYLKDHLGSIRVVLNSTNTVISANDYDCWGYPLENRTYQPENSKYKFTGKERDKDLENNYDYFGVRYYDSRIGRWGGVEPLLDNNISFTPYNYCKNNPVIFIDPNGAWDEYVNEAGKYLGSDNDPNSNEVRVTSDEEWNQTNSKQSSSEEKRNELQSRSTLLNEYKFGISISEQTWNVLESQNVERLDPYVINQSDYTIYYKPEEGDLPWPIAPHTDLYTRVDGLNTPWISDGNVYKVPDYYRTVVNSKGVPDIRGIPLEIIGEVVSKIRPLLGEIKSPGSDWNNLRDVYKK